MAFFNEHAEGFRSKKRTSSIARQLKSVHHVFDNVGGTENVQPRNDRDPLAKLFELGKRQFPAQLRLAREHDVQEFCVRCFKIGEQAQSFKNRDLEILRFVHHHQDALPGARALQQKLSQTRQCRSVAGAGFRLNLEFSEQTLQELLGVALRVKQERALSRILKMPQQREQQRGFAHAWLSDDGREAHSGLNPVGYRSQRLPMSGAQVEKFRIGCHPERLFAQPIEVEKH